MGAVRNVVSPTENRRDVKAGKETRGKQIAGDARTVNSQLSVENHPFGGRGVILEGLAEGGRNKLGVWSLEQQPQLLDQCHEVLLVVLGKSHVVRVLGA